MLTKLLLLIGMVTSGLGGWWLNTFFNGHYKDDVVAIQAANAKLATERTAAQQALQDGIQKIKDDYAQREQKLKADGDDRAGRLQAALERSDTRLAELNTAHTAKQRQLDGLQARLANAAQPVEREKIIKEIEVVKGEDRLITVEVDGLGCVNKQVPANLLAEWRGGKP